MKKNDYEPIGEIYIDTHLDNYRNYLDDHRIHKIVSLVGEKTVLGKYFFLLLMHLRGVAYNASMPYLIPNSIEVFHSAFIQKTNPRQVLLDFSSAIMARLSRELPELTKSPRLARKLKDCTIAISKEYLNSDNKLSVVKKEYIWNAYIEGKNQVFIYMVWSNQRVSYLSGFSAYDDFLGKVVKDAINLPKCRTTSGYFVNDIEKAFGSEVAKLAWTGYEMTTLREVRNSLAHAGGKLIDTLKQREHNCKVIDDMLQITPTDIKRLFEAITSAVEAIVNHSSNNQYLTNQID